MSASKFRQVAGPIGIIDVAIDPAFQGQGEAAPTQAPIKGLAMVAHPHPLFGGSRDNKVVITVARALTQKGFHVLRPNFRGVGQSQGVFDEGNGESADLASLVQACRMREAPSWWPSEAAFAWPEPGAADGTAVAPANSPWQPTWVLAGFSFGAFVQTKLAQMNLIEHPGLILLGLAASRFPVQAAPGSLVIHGEKDDVVPLEAVLEWARPQHLPVTVIPGAGHFFHGQLVVVKTLVTDFLTSRYNTT